MSGERAWRAVLGVLLGTLKLVQLERPSPLQASLPQALAERQQQQEPAHS